LRSPAWRTDIFPENQHPVVAVVWQYWDERRGIQNRIVAIHERQMAQLVDDVEHMEANSYNGRRRDQGLPARGSKYQQGRHAAQFERAGVLEIHAAEFVPPLVLRQRDGCADHSVQSFQQLAADTDMNDVGQNTIGGLANVQGASVPQPYGGKPKAIMADLDRARDSGQCLSPQEITVQLTAQNIIALRRREDGPTPITPSV